MVTQTRSHEGVTYGHMRGNYILLSTLLIAGCDAMRCEADSKCSS